MTLTNLQNFESGVKSFLHGITVVAVQSAPYLLALKAYCELPESERVKVFLRMADEEIRTLQSDKVALYKAIDRGWN